MIEAAGSRLFMFFPFYFEIILHDFTSFWQIK